MFEKLFHKPEKPEGEEPVRIAVEGQTAKLTPEEMKAHEELLKKKKGLPKGMKDKLSHADEGVREVEKRE